MRIGIFGGTFNPPHCGHKNLALQLKEKAKLDKIIIIPTFTPPHKQGKEHLYRQAALRLRKSGTIRHEGKPLQSHEQ